ncbi:MAG: PRD domain-containing protein [Oscillospiraceae bacterium]|nr:PRD domain-containing protein [Oscillospiraceae bacterium]
MKIVKPINNNVVRALDSNHREVIVTGKGIGFKTQPGANIPPDKIAKVFVMSSQNNLDRLNELFGSLPESYIALTDEIFEYAKVHLQKRLNEAAYFTLADHISFAMTRHQQGMEFQNVLLPEIRRFYPKEFEIGMYALQIIKERLDVDMPEDEAASIAMHVLNAEYNISISETVNATKLMDQIIAIIIQKNGSALLDTGDYYRERFYRHLRYLAQCVIKGEALAEYGDDGLFEILSAQYPQEMSCAKAVASALFDSHQFTLSREEISRLAIHIRLIRPKDKQTVGAFYDI